MFLRPRYLRTGVNKLVTHATYMIFAFHTHPYDGAKINIWLSLHFYEVLLLRNVDEAQLTVMFCYYVILL